MSLLLSTNIPFSKTITEETGWKILAQKYEARIELLNLIYKLFCLKKQGYSVDFVICGWLVISDE